MVRYRGSQGLSGLERTRRKNATLEKRGLLRERDTLAEVPLEACVGWSHGTMSRDEFASVEKFPLVGDAGAEALACLVEDGRFHEQVLVKDVCLDACVGASACACTCVFPYVCVRASLCVCARRA